MNTCQDQNINASVCPYFSVIYYLDRKCEKFWGEFREKWLESDSTLVSPGPAGPFEYHLSPGR